MKKTALLLLILCLAMGLYAQGAVEATAPKELVIYSSVDEANSLKITSAFTEQTGIKVSSVHLSSGPALSRMRSTSRHRHPLIYFHIRGKTPEAFGASYRALANIII